MPLITVVPQRHRNSTVAFTQATLPDLMDDFNDYEVARAAETDKTWTVQPISIWYDGVNYNMVAVEFYPEQNDDRVSQVPILP